MNLLIVPSRASHRHRLLLGALIFLLALFYHLRARLDDWILSTSSSTPNGTANRQPSPRDGVKTLVIAATTEEDVGWTINQFEDEVDSGDLSVLVYYADDQTALYHSPVNKGHEAMAYLSYIVDHYYNLSDISIFMHSHQVTWHNNDLLLSDAAMMVKRLRPERVLRHGYMNLRCHHDPGCPEHIDLQANEDDINIPEATIMKNSWKQLFPDSDIPKVLSQPCCAQFAVSRDQLHQLPYDTYVFYRDWIIHTDMDDKLSGRVFEYLWQFIFAGVEEFCPSEHVCYCDGYGVCLGGKKQWDDWLSMSNEAKRLGEALNGEAAGPLAMLIPAEISEEKRGEVWERINHLHGERETRRLEALERGLDSTERQKELGSEHSI